MEQKHFMDIVRIKEKYEGGFQAGNQIVIQEKVDGSNASIRYDMDSKKLIAFSRKNELNKKLTLRGFWDYVQTLPAESYADTPQYIIFGEWLVKNAIRYKDDAYNKWYVFDIYDAEKEKYLPQTEVRRFCEKHELIYVKTFYEGPFISWDHCRSFVGKSDIAVEQGEGVVVKNQSRLNDNDKQFPFVLKIVGDHFKEVQKANYNARVEDPEKMGAQRKALEIASQIVTRRRIEKELYKMRDEGLIPDEIESRHLNIIMKNLPKRIYEDCLKEEPESVREAGEYFGRMCSRIVVKLVKEIIIAGL